MHKLNLVRLLSSGTRFHLTSVESAHRTTVADSFDLSWKPIFSDKPITLHDSSENIFVEESNSVGHNCPRNVLTNEDCCHIMNIHEKITWKMDVEKLIECVRLFYTKATENHTKTLRKRPSVDWDSTRIGRGRERFVLYFRTHEWIVRSWEKLAYPYFLFVHELCKLSISYPYYDNALTHTEMSYRCRNKFEIYNLKISLQDILAFTNLDYKYR